MRKLLCYLVFFLSGIVILAQPDSLTVAGWLTKAQELVLENEPEPARALVYQYLEYQQTEDNLSGWLDANKVIGKLYRDKVDAPELALQYFDRNTLDSIWRQPASSEEWDKLAWCYANLGYLFEYSFHNFAGAAGYYDQARQIISDHLDPNAPLVARYVYSPLGNIYTRLGDNQSAELLLKQALDIFQDSGKSSYAAQATSDLAVVYYNQNRLNEAIQLLREGLTIPDQDLIAQGLMAGNLAKCLAEKGAQAEAVTQALAADRYFERFLQEYEVMEVLHYRANVANLLAAIYVEQGDRGKAETYFKKSRDLFLQRYPAGKSRDLGKMYNEWAAFSRSQNPEQAIGLFQKALESVLTGFDGSAPLSNPDPADFYPENTIMEALAGKASALQVYFEKSNELSALEAALECHDLIFEVEKLLRRTYNYEVSKLFNLEESRARSEAAIALSLQLETLTGEATYRNKAFAFAERSKSILLLEAFTRDNALLAAGISKTLQEKEQKLQEDITHLEKELFEARSQEDTRIKTLEEQLFAQRRQYAAFIHQLEVDYPAYYNLRYKFETAGPDDVRQFLNPGQALVEYFTGQDQLYIFVITHDQFTVLQQPHDFPLAEWIVQMRQDIEAFQFGGADRQALCRSYSNRAHQLYRRLVAPVAALDLPERWIIVPSGVLGYLPFDALLTEPADPDCHFARYPYLLHQYAISYGYSATLQSEIALRGNSTQDFLGVAPAFDGHDGFTPLLNNQASIAHNEEIFGGISLLGPAATIYKFKEQAPHFGILQLATHAQANTQEGDFSFVVFTGENGGYDSLFVNDIYLLDLSAELVVLSACETAVGTVYESEGIISLARAFLYAGAHSLITTLWSINEDTNLRIIEDFYQEWQNGLPKDQALRQAKLHQLENSDRMHAHPVFWAALAPIGSMAPPTPKTVSSWWWLGGLGGMALLALLFLGLRRGEHKKVVLSQV